MCIANKQMHDKHKDQLPSSPSKVIKMLKGQKKHIDKEQGQTNHEAPHNVNYRSTQNKNHIGTTALERSVVYTTGGGLVEYETENYCTLLMPASHRAAFAKFRCGVVSIRIETGRFENLDASLRQCQSCHVVENETHVILECPTYNGLRNYLFAKAVSVLPDVTALNSNRNMLFLFSNKDMIRIYAETCFKILQEHNSFFYK